MLDPYLPGGSPARMRTARRPLYGGASLGVHPDGYRAQGGASPYLRLERQDHTTLPAPSVSPDVWASDSPRKREGVGREDS